MKFVKLLLTFALLAVAFNKAHSLECYICDEDCEELTDAMLGYCGPSTEEPTTATTTSQSTTTVSGGPTAPQTTTTTAVTGTTTETPTQTTTTTPATGTPTTTVITPPGEATTTTVTPATGTPTTTEVTTPAETTTTTTTTTVITPAETTTTTTTVVTIPAETTTTTTAPATGTPTTVITTTEATTTTEITTTAPGGSRKRRSLSLQEKAVDQMLSNYRSNSRLRRAANDAYACYAISKQDGDNMKRHYGCIMIPTEQNGCEAVRDKLDMESSDDNKEDCVICFDDRCNSSATLRLSAFALIGLMFMKLLL